MVLTLEIHVNSPQHQNHAQADVSGPDKETLADRGEGELAEAQSSRALRRSGIFWSGVILVALSFVLYGLLPALPFLPLPASTRVAIASALVIAGETAFWAGGLLLGKDLVKGMRGWLPGAFFALVRFLRRNRTK